MKFFKKPSMRETKTGVIYLRLADRFDMSEENRRKLDLLLAEPDNEDEWSGPDIEWLERVQKLFPIIEVDRYEWYSVMWGIVRNEARIRGMEMMN